MPEVVMKSPNKVVREELAGLGLKPGELMKCVVFPGTFSFVAKDGERHEGHRVSFRFCDRLINKLKKLRISTDKDYSGAFVLDKGKNVWSTTFGRNKFSCESMFINYKFNGAIDDGIFFISEALSPEGVDVVFVKPVLKEPIIAMITGSVRNTGYDEMKAKLLVFGQQVKRIASLLLDDNEYELVLKIK